MSYKFAPNIGIRIWVFRGAHIYLVKTGRIHIKTDKIRHETGHFSQYYFNLPFDGSQYRRGTGLAGDQILSASPNPSLHPFCG
jgi:hypothetical protein